MHRKYIGFVTRPGTSRASSSFYNLSDVIDGRATSTWPGPDQYYSSTIVNYHMNDGAGASTITDNSPLKLTPVLRGLAKLTTGSTSQVTEGTIYPPSGYRTVLGSDGATNNYLWVSGATELNLGTGAYTVEGWMQAASFASQVILWNRQSQTYGLTKEYTFYIESSTNLTVYYGVRGTSSFFRRFPPPATLVSGSWYHIAFTRDAGGTMRAFVNGTASVTTVVDSVDLTAPNSMCGSIGNFGDFPGPGYAYFIDDVRLTKNVCRYSASFATSSIQNPNY